MPVLLAVAMLVSSLAALPAPAAPAAPAAPSVGTTTGTAVTSTAGTTLTNIAGTTITTTTGMTLTATAGTTVTGGGGGPATAGTSKSHKARSAPVQVLNPATPALLQSVTANEHEVAQLSAYGVALNEFHRAEAVETHDGQELVADVAAWHVATAKEVLAVRAAEQAASTLALYQRALYELGIAEYTGQTAMEGSGLQAAQHQLVVVQYGEVAAADATDGLDRAQKALAVAEQVLRLARALVSFTGARAQSAQHAYLVAKVQLSISSRALLEVRTWALAPAKAPVHPVLALAVLEKLVMPSPTGSPAADAADHLSVSPSHARYQLRATTTAPATTTTTSTTTTTTTTATTTTTVPAARGGVLAATGATRSQSSDLAGQEVPVLNKAQLFEEGPTILGSPLLSAKQIEAWFATTGAEPVTEVPIGKLVADYLSEGQVTGVRADVAFAQSVVETGYFSFPTWGQDPYGYNNFAGIGACDTCQHGFRYSSPMAGVTAQEQLLKEYALPYEQPTSFAIFGVAGSSQTWMALSGTWATNINYGYAILSVYNQMLTFVIESEAQQFGLSSGTAPSLANATPAVATKTGVTSGVAPASGPASRA